MRRDFMIQLGQIIERASDPWRGAALSIPEDASEEELNASHNVARAELLLEELRRCGLQIISSADDHRPVVAGPRGRLP
jgi:hypothetical protein